MTAKKTNRSFNYWQWRILIVTMVGYSLFYFVRKNFSFAMPGLSAEYGISKTSLGIILTIIGLIYGFSRFANGVLADRFNARIHMSIGLLLCAIANLAFGFGTDISTWITGQASGTMFTNTLVLIIGLLLVLNNIFQGAGYPPCARLLCHWIPPQELATKQSIWNSSHSIGASLVSILCGYVMGHLGTDLSSNAATVSQIAANLHVDTTDPVAMQSVIASVSHYGAWRWCFWIPSMIAFAGAVFLFIFLRDTPSTIGLPELSGTESKENLEESGPERKAFIHKMVYGNKIIWILAIADFFVYVARFSVLDWGPTFLKEARGLSLANAGWTVAIFEIFGIIGTLVAGWATDKFFQGKTQRTCAIDMIGLTICMIIFWLLPSSSPMWLVVLVLAFAGFFVYGPQALVGIAASNQATKKAAATANGLIGIFCYTSVFISGLGIGALVDWINKITPGKGWDYVFMMMIVIAFIGALIFIGMWKMKANGYDKIDVDSSK